MHTYTKHYLFFLLFCLPFVGKGQGIETWAGTGVSGPNSGDGGQATSAVINYPIGGVFDKFGNFYFATGTVGNTVRKITPSGIITTVAGTGTANFSGDGGLATLAELDFPHALAVDTLGNIFIGDFQNNRVRKIDISTGIISTVAGDGSAFNAGDGGLAIQSSIYHPRALCFDHAGNLYISGQHRIRKINSAGVINTVVGNDTGGHTGDGGLAINAKIANPYGLCTDSANLYIGDHISVRKVNFSTGVITSIAGNGIGGSSGDGGLAINAQVNAYMITVDKIGNLYIGEDAFHKVRKVNNQGIITTVAGTGVSGDGPDGVLATASQIKAIFGITTDTCGNLYIADGHSWRIRKVSFNPNCFPLNINEKTPLTFTLSPNPATSQLTITSNTKLQHITIINAIGIEVRSVEKESEKITIDISELPPGNYFLRALTPDGTKRTEKIIKQ